MRNDGRKVADVCLIDSMRVMNNLWMARRSDVRDALPTQSHAIFMRIPYCLFFFKIFFLRPAATACRIIMLLGAWPIGGNKRPGHTNATDRNGKCRFLLLCGSYGLFLIVGAAIFSVIEAPLLDRYQRDLVDTKDKFLQSNPCIKGKLNFVRRSRTWIRIPIHSINFKWTNHIERNDKYWSEMKSD